MSFILALSGLMGAAGIVLAAVGAHGKPGAGLDNAAHMLLFHAIAVLAVASLVDGGRFLRPLAMIALGGWIVGACLFAGDIALRAFAGFRLFPMAAPAGGTVLILSWLALAAAAIGGRP